MTSKPSDFRRSLLCRDQELLQKKARRPNVYWARVFFLACNYEAMSTGSSLSCICHLGFRSHFLSLLARIDVMAHSAKFADLSSTCKYCSASGVIVRQSKTFSMLVLESHMCKARIGCYLGNEDA